jgi:acetylglutamate kinase
MNDPVMLNKVLGRFARIPGLKIMVHGGGDRASKLCEKLGIEPKMVNGRRITDEATLEVVTMVYAGLVNKHLVAQLQAIEVNAIGLSGADANILPAVKRPVGEIDYGFAGDLQDSASTSRMLEILLDNDMVPVCCSLTHDGKGQLLNTNADTIARHLGITLSGKYKVTLVYCLDKPGVLQDQADLHSVLPNLDPGYYQELVNNGTIVEGMIPKLDNAFAGLRLGIEQIYLCDWQDITGASGTKITLS